MHDNILCPLQRDSSLNVSIDGAPSLQSYWFLWLDHLPLTYQYGALLSARSLLPLVQDCGSLHFYFLLPNLLHCHQRSLMNRASLTRRSTMVTTRDNASEVTPILGRLVSMSPFVICYFSELSIYYTWRLILKASSTRPLTMSPNRDAASKVTPP